MNSRERVVLALGRNGRAPSPIRQGWPDNPSPLDKTFLVL